jgi:hypothetical protein
MRGREREECSRLVERGEAEGVERVGVEEGVKREACSEADSDVKE